jgi:hypothetical protein
LLKIKIVRLFKTRSLYNLQSYEEEKNDFEILSDFFCEIYFRVKKKIFFFVLNVVCFQLFNVIL